MPVLTPEKIIQKKDIFQKIGLLRWEDGKNHQLPQDFADMLGWKELAGIVDKTSEKIEDKDREREKAFFESVALVGEITNQYAREKGTRVYLLKNAKISVNDVLKQEIREKKNKNF